MQCVVVQYRNTPDPNTQLSPSQCVFGRPIKDFIPILPGRYQPHPTWSDTLATREKALRNSHMKVAERWSEHTKGLLPLAVGNHVRIQNQTGPYPTKWDKTGIVIEVHQFDQYIIRIDGSGTMTTCNRKFLRKYLPAQTKSPSTMTYSTSPCYCPDQSNKPSPVQHQHQQSCHLNHPLQSHKVAHPSNDSPKRCAPQPPPNYKTPPLLLQIHWHQ